ncbi:MAG: transposase, partial [Actinomycetota bacterium]|nr:transposase [Actinomycetota bacterium]
ADEPGTTDEPGSADEPGSDDVGDVEVGAGALSGRFEVGERACGYAGAMLLHAFLGRAGAGQVLAALPSGPARRYDAASLMLCAVFGFALGSSSAEGTKHLLSADAGALAGVVSFPHLRTLRPRLAALADTVDPLGVQVALATAMLDADDEAPEVFFVDDHFVAYTGAAAVAKGWNTRRRLAEPGRDDTVIIDKDWRAICFSSGPPSGLSKTMLDPLDQLARICRGRRTMIGFDRGGSYPKTFAQLNERGVDWVTYRRAPLAAPTATPKRTWVDIDGRRRYLSVADEIVNLRDVGAVRQISVYEHGAVTLQILTSDLATPAARLAHLLACRWRIENTFKYLEDHHGIHWLCDYRKDVRPDTTLAVNPARAEARDRRNTAADTVAALERQIGAHATGVATKPLTQLNAEIADLQQQLGTARRSLTAAQDTLKPIPAKLPANTIDPDATRAWPRTNHRALQMVCRLLAYNAELDLARNLNAYLQDPDEYRAITRNLLHQPGHINYTPTGITVTIRQPDAPRIAHALTQLTDQLNQAPPKLTGDNRPITYKIGAKP